MNDDSLNCNYGLRIDIDTIAGYLNGVPRLLEIFNNIKINTGRPFRATFAITTGPDRTALNLINLFPPFARMLGVHRDDNVKRFPRVREKFPAIMANKSGFMKSLTRNSAFLEAEKEYRIIDKASRMGHGLCEKERLMKLFIIWIRAFLDHL
ncbi:MAG: hypothetical protein ACXADA_01220 [Candidatus Hodarchaeales archaeon]